MQIANQTIKQQILDIEFRSSDDVDESTLRRVASYLCLSRYAPAQGRVPAALHAEAGYLITRFNATDQARLIAIVNAFSARQGEMVRAAATGQDRR